MGEGKRGSRGEGELKKAKISEKGVTFYSHIDGTKHFITPEKSIKIQEDLGADIIMAFDVCPASTQSYNEVKKAIERTHRWLIRCIKSKKRKDQALFPICQGAVNKDLRIKSANFINKMDLPGNAIGGVAVGESKKNIYKVTDWCTDILSETKPRYLMGIGYPEDIVKVVSLGIDMFDCVLPTRLARHGLIWVKSKKKNLKGLDSGYESMDLRNAKFKDDFKPLSDKCLCYACSNGISRSYLRHLILEKETLGIHLLTQHNLFYVHGLIGEIKDKIKAGKF